MALLALDEQILMRLIHSLFSSSFWRVLLLVASDEEVEHLEQKLHGDKVDDDLL